MTIDSKLPLPAHMHRWDDQRGRREVYLNGELISYVRFADNELGVVEICETPLRLEGDRLVTRTLHGQVQVDFF